MSKGNENKPDGRKISRKLKPRQRKFIANYTDPTKETFSNGTKSAIAAGYSKTSARSTASEILTKPNVRREIERVLDEAGATREKVAQVLHNGLEAKTTRVFCQDGQVIYSEPMEDHPTQVRAAEVVEKLRGDFPTTHEQERVALLQIQQTFNLVPPVDPVPEVIEIEGTVEE